ncbi:iron chelate uptake ABC transporter family permease subunit [Halobacillus halophilus]|uniref:FecCD family ABC transporter permease n=1 Tax=Halobacillus halophilus TaxID=1570 RepID=UPI00136EA520|nr:iron ABC transporter permease [Halobacillus halophilus]MYL29672.1 iron chelate uptake ABC transporter family permease subunit [Halobacillus halophilus]
MLRRHPTFILTFTAAAVFILAIVNVGIGDFFIPPLEIMQMLIGQGDADLRYIVFNYRAPRIVLAILVGGALAVAGVIMQTILNNSLAAPDTLGVSGGAAVTALVTASVLPSMSMTSVSLAAFIGGAAAAFIVYALAYKDGANPVRLALVGVSVSALCGSGVELSLLKLDANAQTSLLWLNGSLFGRTWEQVLTLAPITIGILLVLLLFTKTLDSLKLGGQIAMGLGVSVEKMKMLLLGLSTLLTGVSVSAVGMIGFVGLISPHITRQLVGLQHRYVLPGAALVGSFLLLLADTIGRSVLQPLEIPAGIVISLIGAPYFLFLLYQESKQGKREA